MLALIFAPGSLVAAEATFQDIVEQTGFAAAAADDKPDYTCTKTKSCEIGCCGKMYVLRSSIETAESLRDILTFNSDAKTGKGVCGFGPDFCGKDCFSDCSRKSECDPGWGIKWSNASTCPLNVCCSK